MRLHLASTTPRFLNQISCFGSKRRTIRTIFWINNSPKLGFVASLKSLGFRANALKPIFNCSPIHRVNIHAVSLSFHQTFKKEFWETFPGTKHFSQRGSRNMTERSHVSEMLSTSENDLAKAGKRLREGGLVAFPTETVYGLGANALDRNAVLSIFEAKGRPLTDPLIVHVTSLEGALELLNLEGHTKEVFIYFAKKFWPGPLTLVAKAAARLPKELSAGTGYVGVRCPSLPVARDLINIAKVPVAAPSANRFGHVSPTNAQHVYKDLGNKNVTIVDGGECCQVGIESTVLKIDENRDGKHLILYRKGGIPEASLLEALQEKGWREDTVITTPERKRRQPETINHGKLETEHRTIGDVAPGQELTHYAPDVNTWLVGGPVVKMLNDQADSALSTFQLKTLEGDEEEIKACSSVVIDFNKSLSKFQSSFLEYRDLSESGDVVEAASNIFSFLRWSESVPGAKTVLLADIAPSSCSTVLYGKEHVPAVSDRMYRAASGKVAVKVSLNR